MMRVDEEGASKAKSLKTLREVEAQMNELAEDLDAEKGKKEFYIFSKNYCYLIILFLLKVPV